MSAPRRTEIWVGLFLAVGLLGGGGFVSWRLAQAYVLDRPWRVDLSMPQGYGLAPGSRVKLSGVPVGSVQSVDLEPDGRVRAALGIERRHSPLVTSGARFAVTRPMVLGDPWVEILPGPGEPLPEGSVRIAEAPEETLAEIGITKERVTAMIEGLERLVADAGAIVASVRAGEGGLGRLVTDPALVDEATQAVRHANAIMSSARDPSTTVGRLLTEDRLYQDLAAVTEQIRSTLEDLRGGEGETRETVQRLNALLADADRTVNDLGALVRRVNSGEGTLGRFATDAAVYDETRRILGELRETLEDLREQAPISTFLGALLGAF